MLGAQLATQVRASASWAWSMRMCMAASSDLDAAVAQQLHDVVRGVFGLGRVTADDFLDGFGDVLFGAVAGETVGHGISLRWVGWRVQTASRWRVARLPARA